MPSSSKHSADQLPLLDLSEASRAIQKKEVSPVELTQACLSRIEKLNPQLNAFITVTGAAALEAAHKAEAEIARGEWKKDVPFRPPKYESTDLNWRWPGTGHRGKSKSSIHWRCARAIQRSIYRFGSPTIGCHELGSKQRPSRQQGFFHSANKRWKASVVRCYGPGRSVRFQGRSKQCHS